MQMLVQICSYSFKWICKYMPRYASGHADSLIDKWFCKCMVTYDFFMEMYYKIYDNVYSLICKWLCKFFAWTFTLLCKFLLIRHNRRQLDLALPVHQLGLTNMAKLELLKTEATKEGAKVRIGLEVANEGGRFQREFDPSTSLWDVVKSFEKDDGRFGK